MKIIIVIFTIILCNAIAFGNDIKLADDGFPTGQDTPEGVACDLARAFINADTNLFCKITIPAYGGEDVRAKRQEFIDNVIKGMSSESLKGKEERTGPQAIGICFAARHLSLNGPSSYAYAAFNYHDVMFVDVGTLMRDGGKYLNRTLVLKDKDGIWYVHPVPSISPLLMAGLNEESPSTKSFNETENKQ